MEFWRELLKLHQRPSITVKEYCLQGKMNYRILVKTYISGFAQTRNVVILQHSLSVNASSKMCSKICNDSLTSSK